MALKSLLEITVLASTIVFALAEYECQYLDGRILFCDSCCEYDCCTGSNSGGGGARSHSNIDVGGVVAAIVGGVVGGLAILVFLSICVRRRCLASRGGIVVHQPSDVLLGSGTILAVSVAPGIASPGVAGRPVYNPNVPQTGTYDYEQATAGYIPIKETLTTAPPPPYSP